MDNEQNKTARLLFVSYGRQDAADFVERLRTDLKARGYDVWQDVQKIQPGIDFVASIEEGIRASCVLLALLSPYSVRRQRDGGRGDQSDSVCLDELSFARFGARKPIIPIMVIPCEPPFVISRLNWIDMTGCNRSAESYASALKHLLQAIEDAQHSVFSYRSEKVDLDEWDFTPFLNDKREHFVGRDWLFEAIDSWRKSANEKALLLTGSPGTGKSAIVAQLVHYNPGGQVLAYHCCQADTLETLKPDRFVRSIASQIAGRLESYASLLSKAAIREALSERRCQEDPASSFEEGILIPLHRIALPEEGIRYVIIDALDEAARFGRRLENGTILDVLSDRIDRLPPWMRIVATTRKEPAVMTRFKALRAIDLDRHGSHNIADVAVYIRHRVDALTHKQLGSSGNGLASEIESILSRKSEGNFLYVVEVMKGIERDQYSLDRLDLLPPGIESLYERFFERQFPQRDEGRACLWHPAQKLLQVVAAAQEPLTKEQLSQTGGDDIAARVPELLNLLSPYLVAVEADAGPTRYRVFHKSFIEWLTADQRQGECFFVSRKAGHRQLAEAGWAEYMDGPDRMSPYMQRYLPTHLAEIEEDEAWERLLTLVKENRLGLVRRWLDKGYSQEGLACMRGLVNYLTANRREVSFTAGLLTEISKIYTRRGMYDVSERHLKRALGMSSARNSRRVRAIAQHELGSLHFYRGDTASAKRAYRRALRTCIWGLHRLLDEEAANLSALATIALSQYQHEKAIRLASGALRKSKDASDVPHIISSGSTIASAHKSMMRYEEAKVHLNAARLLAGVSGEQMLGVSLMLLHGWLSFERATIVGTGVEEAEGLFQSAAAEAAELGHLWYNTEGQLGVMWCALARKDTGRAADLLREVEQDTRSYLNRYKDTKLQLTKAAVTHQYGKLEDAEECYQHALRVSQAYEYSSMESTAWTGLGAVQFHMHDRDAAESAWKKAHAIAVRCSPARARLTQISIENSRIDPRYTPR